LKQVVFQAGLGTYENKRIRLKELCSYLCEKTDQGDIKKDVVQAADLAKIDLLTEMVREFPTLQGKVGGLYAKAEGYPAAVWRAIYEHYQPVGLEDEPPATVGGAILSIADKTDSIVGSVGRGVEITGSSDPFGLRRNANGVCKVILDKKLDFSFGGLIAQVILGYEDIMKERKSPPEITDCVLGLFEQRLRFLYETWGFSYDIVSAALGPGLDNIHHTHLRLKALDSLRKTTDFEPFVLMAKRVNNILRDQPSFELNSDLLEEKEEKELYSMYSIVRDHVLPMLSAGDYGRAQGLVFRLRGPLSAFFDRILVMAEDRKIRQNRLALLQEIRDLLSRLADFSRVVVEGEKKEASA
jgi:glycyl-tRNA synthetase beta chain